MAHTMITVAPTGAESSKADVPALPVTLDELVETAQACEAAGAAMIHIHIRDDDAKPTLDLGRLNETVAAVRERQQPDRPALDGRIGARRLRPAPARAGRRARLVLAHLRHGQLRRRRLHEQLAVHGRALPADPGAPDRAGVRALRPRPRARAQPAARQVRSAPSAARCTATWSWVCQAACRARRLPWWRRSRRCPMARRGRPQGSGRSTMPVMFAALSAGGHLRVGMEDVVTWARGVPVRDNAQLVERAAAGCDTLPTSADDAGRCP